ncbi:heterokaryon incompatibility protein-domain-containing protein [Echria macrotheca]|uniref:Heterokaryon incompatibility protein-domain-containing protein n=1 Tax=Echria macrotheca TaxID=438768 RepID=A0AAJ0B140_9PEZI|nr:heterokaryon incompatibility protein-domain-containing protein [Echria macrotheca]
MLCSTCDAVDFDDLHYEWNVSGYAHHRSFAELATCTNCRFCSAIHDTIRNAPQLSQESDESWRLLPLFLRLIPSSDAIGTEDDLSNLLVSARAPPEEGGREVYLAMFGLYLDRTGPEWETGERDPTRRTSRQGIRGRPVSAFSNSDDCFRLLEMWLKRCLEDERSQNSHFVPTRTIDVGPADDSQHPRLVVHDSCQKPFPWITLSHCWGGSSPLTTNSDTLAEWTGSGIPMPLLPPTFRDAVLITRRLGYRHLWIDSLCIIQDSREDWEHEALRMGDVYRHGQLNISASAARNCHDGIFAKRDNPIWFSSAVRLPFKSARLGVGLEHRSWMYVRAGRWDSFREEVTGAESTLASRGWVLQEAVLSPRTIHYSHRQMLWECDHGTFAEGRVDSLAHPAAKSMFFPSAPGLWSHKMLLPTWLLGAEDNEAEVHALWVKTVENYSARALTVPTDVLPALAGVASVFDARLNDLYMAGLFRGNLIPTLLWKTDSPVERRPGAPLPSWSWASVVGKVSFEINYSSNSIAPAVTGTTTATIIDPPPPHPEVQVSRLQQLTNVNMSPLVLEGYVLEGREMVAKNYQVVIDSTPWWDFDKPILQSFIDISAPVTRHIVLLHLGIWEWHWVGGSNSRLDRTYGGLLLEATDEKMTSYRRIGIALLKARNTRRYAVLNTQDEETIRGWKRRSLVIV